MVAEQIVVKLTADAAQFQAGMGRASQTTQRLGQAVGAAQPHVGRLERAMHGLAFTAIGIPGPLGNVAFALTQIITKTGPLLAVLGIFTGIAVGINRAKKETEEFAAILETARKRIERERQAIGKLGASADSHALRTLRESLRSERALLTSGPLGLGPGGASPAAAQANIAAVTQRTQDLQAAITQLTTALRRDLNESLAEARYRFEHVRDSEASVAHHLRVMKNEAEGWSRSAAAQNATIQEQIDLLTILAEVDRHAAGELKRSQQRILATGPGGLRGMDPRRLKPVIADQDVIDLRRQLEGVRSPLEEAMARLGQSAGKQLILGMVTGIQSMQDILKSIVVQLIGTLLDDAFGGFFGHLFGGGGPSKGIGGLQKSGAKIAPASFSLNVPAGLSAPTTPFAVMRDAEWQKLLRGSLLVAHTDGFRRG